MPGAAYSGSDEECGPSARPRGVDWSRTLVAAATAPAVGPLPYSLAMWTHYRTTHELSDGGTWTFLAYILGLVVSYGACWSVGLLAHVFLVRTGQSSASAYVVAFTLAAFPSWAAVQSLGPDMPFETLTGTAGAVASLAGAVPAALLFRLIYVGVRGK